MFSSDLSQYASLFIFGIAMVVALLAYINYRIGGSERVGITILLLFVGMLISFAVIKLADFADATPETVTTLCIGTLFPLVIYSSTGINKWRLNRKKQEIASKIHNLQMELNFIESKPYCARTIWNLVVLFEKCGEDVYSIEQHPGLSSQKIFVDKANKIRKTIKEFSSQVQTGG